MPEAVPDGERRLFVHPFWGTGAVDYVFFRPRTFNSIDEIASWTPRSIQPPRET